jgi:hypothetical protein
LQRNVAIKREHEVYCLEAQYLVTDREGKRQGREETGKGRDREGKRQGREETGKGRGRKYCVKQYRTLV